MPRSFLPAEILLPKSGLEDFAIIAVDQHSSNPLYWKQVERRVENKMSAYWLVLPEAYLGTRKEQEHKETIREKMALYAEQNAFVRYPASFVYVERTLQNGRKRKGLVGMVDLEQYDFHPDAKTPVRVSEKTIFERLPARMDIRREAEIELSHILLLMEDPKDVLFSWLDKNKEHFPLLYDFELMEQGGHIQGWLVHNEYKDMLLDVLDQANINEFSFDYAIGDGNHSLAAAKEIWEELKPSLSEKEQKKHPARFALAELENIEDDALIFHPIHRLLKDVDIDKLLAFLDHKEGNSTVRYQGRKENELIEGEIHIGSSDPDFFVPALQQALDAYLEKEAGRIDYVHDLESVYLADKSIAFIVPAFAKRSLFLAIEKEGSLPRKSFSIGKELEKRYYLEGRSLKPKKR